MDKSLYNEIFKLKQIIRKGWQMRNVQGRVESDAEHTFSMMILALELMSKNDLKLDELKVLKIITYHELCEIDAGDITPYDNISEEEKYKREYACVERLSREYDVREILDIWLEFETAGTDEAKFVKMIDKYDAVLQCKIYAETNNNPEMYNEFYSRAELICKEMENLKR